MTAAQNHRQQPMQAAAWMLSPLTWLASATRLPLIAAGAVQRRFASALGGVALAHIAAQSMRTADHGLDGIDLSDRALSAGPIT